MATTESISSVQPREMECKRTLENIGGSGNSAILDPISEVRSPFSVRAPKMVENVMKEKTHKIGQQTFSFSENLE